MAEKGETEVSPATAVAPAVNPVVLKEQPPASSAFLGLLDLSGKIGGGVTAFAVAIILLVWGIPAVYKQFTFLREEQKKVTEEVGAGTNFWSSQNSVYRNRIKEDLGSIEETYNAIRRRQARDLTTMETSLQINHDLIETGLKAHGALKAALVQFSTFNMATLGTNDVHLVNPLSSKTEYYAVGDAFFETLVALEDLDADLWDPQRRKRLADEAQRVQEQSKPTAGSEASPAAGQEKATLPAPPGNFGSVQSIKLSEPDLFAGIEYKLGGLKRASSAEGATEVELRALRQGVEKLLARYERDFVLSPEGDAAPSTLGRDHPRGLSQEELKQFYRGRREAYLNYLRAKLMDRDGDIGQALDYLRLAKNADSAHRDAKWAAFSYYPIDYQMATMLEAKLGGRWNDAGFEANVKEVSSVYQDLKRFFEKYPDHQKDPLYAYVRLGAVEWTPESVDTIAEGALVELLLQQRQYKLANILKCHLFTLNLVRARYDTSKVEDAGDDKKWPSLNTSDYVKVQMEILRQLTQIRKASANNQLSQEALEQLKKLKNQFPEAARQRDGFAAGILVFLQRDIDAALKDNSAFFREALAVPEVEPPSGSDIPPK